MSSKKRRKDKRKQEQKSKSILENKKPESLTVPIYEEEKEISIEYNSNKSENDKPKRIPISKQLRFEVFKRDKFMC